MAGQAKVGVENLKAVIDLALAGVEAGVAIAKEGKLDVAAVSDMIPVVMAIPAAISAMPSIPEEVSDLDETEAGELVAHVMAKLSIDDVKAQAVIAASLKVVVSAVGLVSAIKS